MVAGGILQTYTLFFLQDVVNLANPGAALGVLAVVVGTTILLCLMPAGILADRIGRRPLLIFSASEKWRREGSERGAAPTAAQNRAKPERSIPLRFLRRL